MISTEKYLEFKAFAKKLPQIFKDNPEMFKKAPEFNTITIFNSGINTDKLLARLKELNINMIGRIVSSVKSSMNIEGLCASNYALSVGRMYLEEEISIDRAVKMIRDKFLSNEIIGIKE